MSFRNILLKALQRDIAETCENLDALKIACKFFTNRHYNPFVLVHQTVAS